MKTEHLISLLAAGAPPADPGVVARRLALALLTGGIGALALLLALLGLRADLARVAALPLFWAKLAFPLCLAAAALWLATRMARPGLRGGWRWMALAVPVLAVWLAAAAMLASAPAPARSALVLGQTWAVCPLLIALLSIPGFIAVFRAMQRLAPTRPRQAGAVSGLLAGAGATVVYCLHCPEMAAPFWGVWYLLGMLLPAALGAMLGPRLLRW